jgi:hypothetical protein
MWTAKTESLAERGRSRVTIAREGERLSYAEVLAGWRDDRAFRAFFAGVLAQAPYDAYLWETPPIDEATLGRGFECVLVDSPALAGFAPDPGAFAAQFAAAPQDGVVAFANLGGDAWLVAPCPRAAPEAYPHLAAFARRAPDDQQQAFWRAVAKAASRRLSDRPLWLSTCGLGVAWLHARLDTRPKYYTHGPYRSAATRGR